MLTFICACIQVLNLTVYADYDSIACLHCVSMLKSAGTAQK